MKILPIKNTFNFRGIDVLKLESDGKKPTRVLALMDEDTFERSSLPEISDVYELEGAYGHPYSGRPIINVFNDDDVKKGIIETAKEIFEPNEIAEELLSGVTPEGVAKAANGIVEELEDSDSSGLSGAIEGVIDFVKDMLDIE